MGLVSAARDARETQKAEATARKERDANPGQQWEYLVFDASGRLDGMQRQFDHYGREGWELVAYAGERAIFKRPL